MPSRIQIIHAVTLVALLFTSSGCTLDPKYERPQSPVPTQYRDAAGDPADTTQLKWRDFFTDPRLKACIELALENNRDLRVAALKVEKARAQYRIERAELLPEINANGAFTRSRVQRETGKQYDASIGLVSYEIDLFGRVRSNSRSALEQYFSLAESRRSTHIALVAEVAIQYLRQREYSEQVQLARQTLESVQSYAEITRRKVESGGAPESDLAMVDVQIETARVSVYTYERLLAQAANALEELLGQPLPDELPEGLSLETQNLVSDIPPGVPSDLITRRPDILAAEHTLLAANANIGAARAAFFPSITLTGDAGYSSSELSNLFEGPNSTWNFSPQISIPIFSGGRNKANLDVAKISKRIEIANYEKTIQTAFREVSDALAARRAYTKQLEAQTNLVQAQQRRLEHAQSKYDNGVSGYLDVLTAQQDYFSSRQTLLSTRFEHLENMITLYKALGGGWE